MRKIILLSVLVLGISLISIAQEYDWVDISNNIPGGSDNKAFRDVHAIGNKVWIVSSNTTNVYFSEDGGASFSAQSIGMYYPRTIFMKSETDGYVGTADGRVFRTTDGTTWNILGGTLLNPIHSISFPLTGDGYCCGNNGWVGTVDSSGINSTLQLSGVITTLNSISFTTTSTEGWVCGASGVCMHFTDGSWNSIIISGAGSLLSIYFAPNTAKGWVVGDGGLISSSSDGTSFSSQTNPDTTGVTLNDVFSIDGENAWIVGGGGHILHTVNGGDNWIMEGEGLTAENLNAVFFTSNTNGYVVGDKTILKYTETTLVEDNKSNFDFRISPNPAKNKIHIVCTDITKESGIILILNMEGKIVKKREVRKGNEDITIDLNDLQPGMYFCKITIDNRSSSKKIILE